MSSESWSDLPYDQAMENLYYVAEVREPDTCRVCGYIIKEARSMVRVLGCPVFDTRERAERFLEGMLSAC